jgi:hypothetical protein
VLQPLPQRGRGAPAPPAAPHRLPDSNDDGPAAAGPREAAVLRGRSVFALTGDGNLQQVNINTGDTAPPVSSCRQTASRTLALVDNIIYTITGQGCGGNPNSVYSLDLNDRRRRCATGGREAAGYGARRVLQSAPMERCTRRLATAKPIRQPTVMPTR